MNANQNVKSAASIEQQLASVNISEHQRKEVLHQARIAEAIVELFAWAGGGLSRPRGSVFAKPSPKY